MPRSLFPFISESSLKYLRSFVKNFPNRIYSVEIKIKSESLTDVEQANPTLRFREEYTEKSLPTSGTEQIQSTLSEHSSPDRTKASQSSSQSLKTTVQFPQVSSSSNNKLDNSSGEQTSQTTVIERAKKIVNSLNEFTSLSSKPSIQALLALNSSLKELKKHVETHPESSNLIIRENAIPRLLQIRHMAQNKISKLQVDKPTISVIGENTFRHLKENSRQALTMLGHTDPPKGRGIRILSIDGGGTRGLVVIEILRQIEQQCGKPIHQIFDLICGVSTGAIITMLLGALRIPIDECETFYRQVSSYLFKTDLFQGTVRLLRSHAYYDTDVFEKVLKEMYGEKMLIDSKRHDDCPHIVAISAIVNLPTLQPYLFRNYEHHPSSLSHFEGGSSHKIWQAVRASSAAVGYFTEFKLDKHVHQDGAILLNNPTAVAVHEAKLLWPNEEIQCVLSLGSGRYQPELPFEAATNPPSTPTTLKHKIQRLIDSATDTEMVHRLMSDLLPHNTYYRINPVLRDQANIDENRPEKLEAMKVDAQMYLRRNERKFDKAVSQLSKERTYRQSLLDAIRLKSKLLL